MRNVEFSLENTELNIPESSCAAVTKTGFFHQWGTEIKDGGDRNGGFIEVSVAIIEDDETGQVYKIDPVLVKFVQ